MPRAQLPLHALRAFEASARRLSFTAAAAELHVTQAAVSHQVKALEQRLGAKLFRRLARGLVLTDEGQALLPAVSDSFDQIERTLQRFQAGAVREVLSVGVVGTFAVRWLLPRLGRFREAHPLIDLRLSTHNNKVDLAAEGLDMAIRFGDGAWHGVQAEEILRAPVTPLCAPRLAARLESPRDLASVPLLRSYRAQEWPTWFTAAGLEPPQVSGPVFDSLSLMIQAAGQSAGVALGPPGLFGRELHARVLVQPFPVSVEVGSYWLTSLKSRALTPAMAAFRAWCQAPEFQHAAYEDA
ncbi:MAG TPA: LysR family transcriptional regulator [Phenylobacterium sp.]|uniref:LysR family transcriptional regulator n=1 Tax=Phenylobacterium sp. TaxID=1871053 RepID=UPI002CBD0036|nr:LysR family transcriptional regulator [Phenylobacterium sp.]HSV02721.1 LysR family transcriptional regulator [Phenylobacterium sp.]